MSVGFFKNRNIGIKNKSGIPQILHAYDFKELEKSKSEVAQEEQASEDVLEEKIKEGVFIEPWKYQQTEESTNSKDGDGYFKVRIGNDQAVFSNKYFWVEDIHNWCCYRTWIDCPCNCGKVKWNYTVQHGQYNYNVINLTEMSFTPYGEHPEWGNIEQCSSNKSTYFSTYQSAVANYILNYYKSKRINIIGVNVISCEVIKEDNYSPSIYYNYDLGMMVRDPNISFFRDVGINGLQLCVWNGIDGFIPIIGLPYVQETNNGVSLKQNQILYNACNLNGSIIKHRGYYAENPSDNDANKPGWTWGYNQDAYPGDTYKAANWYQSPVSILHALILEGNKKYSIYDKENFQCKRGKSYSIFYPTIFDGSTDLMRSDLKTTYKRAAVRQGIPTANPGVFRTSTGELALSTLLIYGGSIYAFGDGAKEQDVNLLNDFCIDFFGDGKDKSIARDWLRYNANINSNEEFASVNIQTKYESTLDKELIAQTNVKTVCQPKMTLSTEDVAVTIEEPTREDYVSKW